MGLLNMTRTPGQVPDAGEASGLTDVQFTNVLQGFPGRGPQGFGERRGIVALYPEVPAAVRAGDIRGRADGGLGGPSGGAPHGPAVIRPSTDGLTAGRALM